MVIIVIEKSILIFWCALIGAVERKLKMLKFVLLVNKQGQTRLSQYYSYIPVEERVITEADIVRKCLSRNEEAVSFSRVVDAS